jgi:hypothetical protein
LNLKKTAGPDGPAVFLRSRLGVRDLRHGELIREASTQNTAAGHRQGFPDLENLFDYLAGGKKATRR